MLPDSIIMEYAPMTLDSRMALVKSYPVNDTTRYRWESQLISALAWLEGLNLVHGDLHAGIVLLSASDDIRLSGFEAASEIGKFKVLGRGRLPYSCPDKNGNDLPAGAETEQFAYATTVYLIERNKLPYHQMQAKETATRIQRREMPPTQSLGALSTIVDKA